MRRVRHRKRGTVYEVLGNAEAQVSRGDGLYDCEENSLGIGIPLREGDALTIYRCVETGRLWARSPGEFEDGRFEEIEQ